MEKTSKEKRNRISLVAAVSVIIIAGLWFALIRPQQAGLQESSEQTTKARDRVKDGLRRIEKASQTRAELENVTQKLKEIEEGMAPAYKYSWFIQTIHSFRAPYRIERIAFNREQVDDVKLLPNFPYRAATFSIRGVAYYHDLGSFISEFENHFPYFSLHNLVIDKQSMDPASITTPEEQEKLAFKMEIVTLIKPAAPL